MDGKHIFVWKNLEIPNIKETRHHGDALSLLAIAATEDEARALVAHRLRENFHDNDDEINALLAAEPDVWHTDTQSVFEI